MADQVEAALGHCGLVSRPEDVEEVLLHIYPNPSAAVKFFRWSGQSIKHTPYAWNLMVDILGNQGFFDHMKCAEATALANLPGERDCGAVAALASYFS